MITLHTLHWALVVFNVFLLTSSPYVIVKLTLSTLNTKVAAPTPGLVAKVLGLILALAAYGEVIGIVSRYVAAHVG